MRAIQHVGRRFSHLINTDQVFGTHSHDPLPTEVCERKTRDGENRVIFFFGQRLEAAEQTIRIQAHAMPTRETTAGRGVHWPADRRRASGRRSRAGW